MIKTLILIQLDLHYFFKMILVNIQSANIFKHNKKMRNNFKDYNHVLHSDIIEKPLAQE